MKYCLITFRSVTPAQRGESILRRAGITCSVRRTPRWMEEQGCGYCLRIRGQEIRQAVQLLPGAGLPLRRVYCQDERGELKEMTL